MSEMQKTGKRPPFTMIANEVISDKSLKASDKGVYIYLMSKKDGWKFCSKRIASDFADGVDSVRSALKRLEATGYLTRQRLPEGGVKYFISMEKPKRENPTMANSHSGKTPPLNKTKKESKTKKASNIKTSTPSGAVMVEQDMFPDFEEEQEAPKVEAAPTKPAKKKYSDAFEAFWFDYPAGRKGNKKTAGAAFERLSAADKEACHTALFVFKAKDDKWKRGFNPEAVNFINQRRFEDEITAPRVDPGATFRETGGENIVYTGDNSADYQAKDMKDLF